MPIPVLYQVREVFSQLRITPKKYKNLWEGFKNSPSRPLPHRGIFFPT